MSADIMGTPLRVRCKGPFSIGMDIGIGADPIIRSVSLAIEDGLWVATIKIEVAPDIVVQPNDNAVPPSVGFSLKSDSVARNTVATIDHERLAHVDGVTMDVGELVRVNGAVTVAELEANQLAYVVAHGALYRRADGGGGGKS